MTSGPTIFVVDDDEAVRDSLGLLLRSAGHAVQTFAAAEAFLGAYDPDRPGCLVLDVRMPGMTGLDLQARLAADRVPLPIVIISGHGDIQMAVAAVKAGALDFIEKPFDESRLLEAIERAIEVDRQRRQELADWTEIEGRYRDLTAREREVMGLVAEGHPNKVVAAMLGISARTVEIHRARVMEKMGARSVADLVQIATRIKARME